MTGRPIRSSGRPEGRSGRRYSPRTPHLFLWVRTRRGANAKPTEIEVGPGRIFPPLPCLSAQHEAFVFLGRDLVADLPVARHAASVGHEHPRLARHVGAEVP